MYTGRRQQVQRQQQAQERKEIIQKSREQQLIQLQGVYENFQKNLHMFAGKYKEQINSEPDFRDKFNELCEKMDVNPMLSKKTIWSDLGFGDFYNQLAIQILDICAKKKNINGGLMKINDVILDFQTSFKMRITKKDIQRALRTIDCLGGCQMNKDYICTVPIELSGDFSVLLDLSEEKGYVSASLMKGKNWTVERFNNTIDVLRREGMVWVDKKTGTNEYHFYFPSMLNKYCEDKGQPKRMIY